MQIKALFFATLRDLIGEKQLTVDMPGAVGTVAQLRQELVRRYPSAADHLGIALAAVNEEFAFDHQAIHEGDEVAFFPPVSGGANRPEIFRLPDAPIDYDEIIAAITTPKTGAVCLFSGLVRGQTDKDGHLPQTDHLHYEAYAPMAIAKMKQVAAEIRAQWDKIEGVAIVQRVGRLEVGHNTVLIACSSPHRDDGCFEAARYGIDRLKKIVPVWKKEIGPQGETWIEGDYRPQATDRGHS